MNSNDKGGRGRFIPVDAIEVAVPGELRAVG